MAEELLLTCLVVVTVVGVLSLGLNTEQMLLKDMKSLSGSLNLAVSVLYVRLQVLTHDTVLPTATQIATHHYTLQHNTTRCESLQHKVTQKCVSGLPAEGGVGGGALRFLSQVWI